MLLKSAKFYSLSQIAVALLSFIRNIILARMLSVEDFGIAATFSLVIALVESTSAVALDKYIVQARFGYNRRVLATVHMVMVIRGAILSLLLFLVSPLVARIFSLEHIAWVYQILAVIPLVAGFKNQGGAVQQKAHNFITLSMSDLLSQVLGTLALLGLLMKWPDYQAALYVNVLIAVFAVAVSHIFSVSRFSLGLNKTLFADVFRFSWPLLLSGILVFIVLQGDRAIVASFYTVQELAVFTVVFGLLSMPVMVLNKIFQSIYLPKFAAGLHNPAGDVGAGYRESLSLTLFLAGSALIGFTLLGNAVIRLLYGDQYTADFELLFWLSLCMVLRTARTPASTLTLASGNSRITLMINITRAFAIVPAIYFGAMNFDLVYILYAATVGELLAYTLGSAWAFRYVNNARDRMIPFYILLFLLCLAVACYFILALMTSDIQALIYFCGVYMTFLIPMVFIFRTKLRHLINRGNGDV